ncbi:hypothetical protein THAOC_04914, partial [Thalassiosira oceanica]
MLSSRQRPSGAQSMVHDEGEAVPNALGDGFDRPCFPSLCLYAMAGGGQYHKPCSKPNGTSAQPAMLSTWFLIIRNGGLPS